MILVALIVAAVVAIIGVYFVAHSDDKVRRALRGVAQVPIARFAAGTVAKIAGEVTALETVLAPLSGRPCVIWSVRVDEQLSTLPGAAPWTPLLTRSGGIRFLVDDGTHRASVDPDGARILLEPDVWFGDDPSSDEAGLGPAFLAANGLSAEGRVLRYLESTVVTGDVVAVAGHGVLDPDPDPRSWGGDYRQGPRLCLHVRGSSEHPLMISDDPDTM